MGEMCNYLLNTYTCARSATKCLVCGTGSTCAADTALGASALNFEVRINIQSLTNGCNKFEV